MKAIMPKRDRLRRVVILCRNFAANLAYYRVGQQPEHLHLQKVRANFWRAASANFIDICVLEWRTLFADPTEEHHWSKIVGDPAKFKAELLQHAGLNEDEFTREIEIMRRYRDKFLAHLDSDEVMNIPALDIGKKAVWFYHAQVVRREAQPGDLEGLPVELDAWYEQCEREALIVYEEQIR